MALTDFAKAFETFLETVPGAERIDDLAAQLGLGQHKRADFLFANRSIVCEVKSLESRTNSKEIAILRNAGVQVPAGGAWIKDLLRGRADADDVYDKVLNAATTALSEGIDEANKQIRATKEAFGIASADGLLIVLHGRVKDIHPTSMVRRIVQRFAKRTKTGAPYHDQINLICVFSEQHKVEVEGLGVADVTIPLTNPHVPERHDVMAFTKALHERWAAFKGRHPLTVSAPELPPPR